MKRINLTIAGLTTVIVILLGQSCLNYASRLQMNDRIEKLETSQENLKAAVSWLKKWYGWV